MYSPFQLAVKYLQYRCTASNGKGHGTHSPFVFQFITQVLQDKKTYAVYDKVEALRRQLLKDTTILSVEDFGAGSGKDKSNQRTIASIAKNAAKPKKYGQLLYRMVKQYQPKIIIELGTSLGITTSYLAAANDQARVVTMEGSSAIATVANKNFEQQGLKNITLIQGNIDDTLVPSLSKLGSVDFVFIDGNHRKEPTVRYFDQLLPHLHNDSIVVFDDVHWSAEMEQAWDEVKRHSYVQCSIDLFFIGIVFFRKEFLEKQDFSIRF